MVTDQYGLALELGIIYSSSDRATYRDAVFFHCRFARLIVYYFVNVSFFCSSVLCVCVIYSFLVKKYYYYCTLNIVLALFVLYFCIKLKRWLFVKVYFKAFTRAEVIHTLGCRQALKDWITLNKNTLSGLLIGLAFSQVRQEINPYLFVEIN